MTRVDWMSEVSQVKTHAIMDQDLRRAKARTIEALLADLGPDIGLGNMFEVGKRSGYMAAYFAVCSGTQVDVVDVADKRQVTKGYAFRFVTSTDLQKWFQDAFFRVTPTRIFICRKPQL